MRKIGVLAGVAVVLLGLALAGLWTLANPNRHRDFIRSELESRLNRKVTLGDMSLGWLPLRFQVKDTVIAEDSSLQQKTAFVQADNLDIRIQLLPLLSGNVRIDSIELRRPRVELIRTKQGTWNFATIGPAGGNPAANLAPSSQSSEREFSLEQLKIVDGQIGVTDVQHNLPRIGYEHIDITLLHFAAGKPFTLDLAAHVQGDSKQELRLKGEAGPVVAGSPADTPFQGKLSIANVGIEGLLQFLNTQVITKAKGTLSGETDLTSQSGKLMAAGKLKLDGGRVNDVEIGYPISADYKLSGTPANGLINIDNATVQLGPTPLTVAGSLNTSANPPTIDVKITSGDASITEIARLASAFGVAFAPGTSVTGRVSTNVRVKGSTAKPELTGTIAGKNLQISGQGIPQPVQVQAVDLTLTPASIRSNEFAVTSGKTNLVGQFELQQYATNSPSVDLGLRSPGATLPEIQSIAKAYGVNGLDQLSGDGTLNFDLRAKGPLQSLSTAAAARALNGIINVNFSPLKVAGFDTAYELTKLAGFASSGGTEQKLTEFLKIAGRINVKDGIAQTDDLRAQMGIANLATAGTADLASESLNLKISSVFTKEFTDKIGATRPGALLNTALTNASGELVLPAIVTGSLQRPKFAPDFKALALLQKQKYLPSLDNPAAAVGNILEAITGKKPEQTGEGKQSGLKGLLDLFGGKKKEEPKK